MTVNHQKPSKIVIVNKMYTELVDILFRNFARVPSSMDSANGGTTTSTLSPLSQIKIFKKISNQKKKKKPEQVK
jgi:hypothetical protein